MAFLGFCNGLWWLLRRGGEEAQFAPAAAVADGEEDVGVFDGVALLAEAGGEEHEVTRGAVGEQQAVRHVVVEQFEVDLRGTGFAQQTGGAGTPLGDRLDSVEATATGLMVFVERARGAAGEQAHAQRAEEQALRQL